MLKHWIVKRQVFHVEHNMITEWELKNNIDLGFEKENFLEKYARLICRANRRFNLTGLKTEQDILIDLVLGSIEPFIHLNVPRGTKFVDIGTGAGIPGIPIAVFHDDLIGVLIDSNGKKISFVKNVVRDLFLENVRVVQGRAEILARSGLRNEFDLVLSRALAPVSVVAELAAPMLVQGGLLYVYSDERIEELPGPVIEHLKRMGMSALDEHERVRFGLADVNMAFIKKGATPETFPRRMSAIKREAKRYRGRM